MNINVQDMEYLSGADFSSGYRFQCENNGRALRRFERLLELCRGQKILHIGCCDHLDLIQSKIEQGIYLHQNLCKVSAQCVGVDINIKGVKLLNELGFPDVYLPEDVPNEDYDVCLLGDVIEHVGDVVSFLKSMHRYRFKTIIVVTPNAFRLRNFFSVGEVVNTDHRYWFSPYTLCKVLVDAGYSPFSIELCHSDYMTWKGAFLARLLDHMPKYRDTLLVAATPQV